MLYVLINAAAVLMPLTQWEQSSGIFRLPGRVSRQGNDKTEHWKNGRKLLQIIEK
jgi:hypothetical protein